MTQTTDSDTIRAAVRTRYAAAATAVARATTSSDCCTAGASCCGSAPDTDQISSALYSIDEIGELPTAAVLASLGCGNPTALAELKPGEIVLDLGSGGGIDVLLSARRVGPMGFAYGLDMTDEMIALANRNANERDVANVRFLKGEIEHIPLPDASVDVIISNCVINLSADKPQVLREAFRVLKPGGRFAVSDVVVQGTLPSAIRTSMDAWAGCLGGALEEREYRSYLANAGFTDVDVEVTRVNKSMFPRGGSPHAQLDGVDRVTESGRAGAAPMPNAVDAHAKPSRTRRTMHILGALLVAVVLPAVVIGVLVGEFGFTAMWTGVLLGGVGAKLGGTRRMSYLAPLMGLAAGLGAFTAYDWWWAALLATVGLIAGAGIGFGWFAPLLMVPYAATFVVPEASARSAIVYGLIVGIATLYGVVLARRFGVPEVVDGERLSASVAAVVAIGFGAVMGASASLGVALGWTEPYWVPEPVLILVLYIIMGKRDRIRGKAVGTALGVVAAIPVAIVSPPAWVLTALGVVVFVVALTQAKTYWLMYGLYTFSIVMLLAAPGGVGFEAEERGVQILAGIALLVVGLAVVHALANWLATRDPQPELTVAA